MSNFIEAINALEELSTKNSISIFIPSLNRAVSFKPITVEQQKNLLDCGYDNVIFHTKFIMTVYETIQKNCLEPDITNKLNIIDRLSIILHYRKSLFGDLINTDDGRQINISDFFNKIIKFSFAEKTIEWEHIKINLQIPKLLDQYEWEKEIRLNTTSLVGEKFVKALGELMVEELSKSIKEIYINEKAISYETLKISEKIDLTKKMPSAISNKIIDFVKELTDKQIELLTLRYENNNSEENEESAILDVTLNTLTVK